jgi:ABC-type bacteriocin/lantibiotic exporter with double-glycine peptidase domain
VLISGKWFADIGELFTQNADVIYVLREGRVAEKGNHAELIARKGM